jgi:dolichol-phosphate mannosyltransferase
MKTLVVIPTYLEASSVAETISELLLAQPNVEILVVDDNSPDGTAGIVRSLAQKIPQLHLLERESKEGLGRAYLAGFEWAFRFDYDLIVEMDADGSHRAEDLGALLAASAQADLVIGSRWIAGGKVLNWPASRKAISRFGNSYAKFVLGTKISDMTSGFRVYRAKFLKQLVEAGVSSHGYSFQVELAYRAARLGTVLEKPITFVERVSGKSKMTLAIVLEALTKVTFWGLKRLF